MAFYELRQFKVLPGKMDEWVKIMEEEIIPFQISKGMVITGSYRGETDRFLLLSGCAALRTRPSARHCTRRSTTAISGRPRSRRECRHASTAPRWS